MFFDLPIYLLNRLSTLKDEWAQLLSEEEKEMINDVKRVLHLNRSICKIKLGKFEDALWDCDKSIELCHTMLDARARSEKRDGKGKASGGEETMSEKVSTIKGHLVKGFYRRSCVYLAKVEAELVKEDTEGGQFWDVDVRA